MAAEDAVNTSIQQCLEQGREDGEQFCHRVKCLCHECSKSIFRQRRSCLRQMVNGQPGLWAQEGSWFYPDVFPCTRRTWQCFTISSCGNAALGGSWIQSGAAGASAGFNDCGTEHSSLLIKFQEASFGFWCCFFFYLEPLVSAQILNKLSSPLILYCVSNKDLRGSSFCAEHLVCGAGALRELHWAAPHRQKCPRAFLYLIFNLLRARQGGVCPV